MSNITTSGFLEKISYKFSMQSSLPDGGTAYLLPYCPIVISRALFVALVFG